ncbi:MAG TPA: hypothetical protein VJB69_03320 [Candidatus Paceibacterota bacterium]
MVLIGQLQAQLAILQKQAQPVITPATVVKSTVLIFADETTYQQLTSEINRLAKDIEKDLGAKVDIKHANYTSPSEIRSIILDSYQNKKGLLGSILIGNIPTFYREDRMFYTDWYYSELSNQCPLSVDGVFPKDFNCSTDDAIARRDVFVL